MTQKDDCNIADKIDELMLMNDNELSELKKEIQEKKMKEQYVSNLTVEKVFTTLIENVGYIKEISNYDEEVVAQSDKLLDGIEELLMICFNVGARNEVLLMNKDDAVTKS